MNNRIKSGFSLVELVVVIAIIAIAAAMALPSFVQWREGLQYRQAGRDMTAFIRNARSRAISTNRQQRIELNIANRSYHLRQGDRAIFSNWPVVAAPGAGADVVITTPRTSIASVNTEIICNPNGTLEFPTVGGISNRITFFDNQTSAVADLNSQRYRIDISITGRIRFNKVGIGDGAP